jgi:hypothetical protein
VVLALILLGAFVIRWRFRECPLERDEGEYAYIGRLILEGVAPYGVAGNHKFPGAYLAFAAIMGVFGQTVAGIHLGMLVVNLTNTVLLFFLGRRLSGNAAGLAAAAAWAFMSVSAGVFGNAAHLTHFVMLAVLGGMLLLLSGVETGKRWYYIAAGVCLGTSIVFRQTSLIFLAFAVVFVWLTARQSRAKQTVVLLGASMLPLISTGLWLSLAGVFPQFWRWTFAEAAAYGSQVTLAEGFQNFLAATPRVISWFWLIWVGAAIGLGLAITHRSSRDWLVIGLFLAGLAALSAGLYFREHYYLAVIGAAIAVTVPLVAQRNYFLETEPIALSRYIYGGNPFPEAMAVARYIQDNSDPGEPMAVLGSEPEIFFYSQRHSASSLIYTYPLMETHRYAHGMQETMAREIEQATPKFIVFASVPTSWLARPDSDRFILTWANEYLSRYYQLDGVADILKEGSQYAWGDAAPGYRPRSRYFINVYRRVIN